MLTGQVKDTIERVRLGFVATITPGGRPAVSPKGTFVVLDDTTLAFGNIRSPGTLQNISHSPEVEVNFVDSFIRKGCRVRGEASVVRRGTCAFDQRIGEWVDLWGPLSDRID
ncbi:MAG: pyridoxamine 5'-phosphate oxidase family protein, partial [Pseudomonadota bacterium]